MYPERLPQPLEPDEKGRFIIDPYMVALNVFHIRVEYLKKIGEIRKPSQITSDEALDDHFDDLWREYRQVCREMELGWPPPPVNYEAEHNPHV